MLVAASRTHCTGCGAPLSASQEIDDVEATRIDSGAAVTRSWRVYGIETGIFGREADLDAIIQAARRTIDDQTCQVLLLSGPEGIGKTRLIAAFNQSLDQHFEHTHLVSGSCQAARGAPYAVFDRLLRGRFYIPKQANASVARQRLIEGVRATLRGPQADESAQLIGSLIGLPWAQGFNPAHAHQDLARVHERAVDALCRLLARDAERQPLVLVIEDLHLAGQETLTLLRTLHERLHQSPILLLCVTQPELARRAPWFFEQGSRRHVRELEPLNEESTRALVRDVLRKAEPLPDELLTLIHDNAFGHPLSIESIVRVLIDQGVIDPRDTPWRVHVDRIAEVKLPQNIEGIVKARLAGLTLEERTTLERAALIGPVFWAGALQLLARFHQARVPDDQTHWPGEDLEARVLKTLIALHNKDMIQLQHKDGGLKDQLEYAFKHEIERQLIRERLDPELSNHFHLLVAQWLDHQATRTEVRERFLEELAHHYEQGGHLAKAAEALVEAGQQAARQYRNQSAVKAFERALPYLGFNDLDTHIEVLHDLGTVLDLMGEPERAIDFYEDLLQSAWLMGHRAKVAVAYNKLGRSHRTLGNYDRALSDLKRGLNLFRDVDDLPGVAASLTDIGAVHSIRGNYHKAQECYEEALQIRQETGDERSQALTLNRLGGVKLRSGRFSEALKLFNQSIDLRRTTGDRRGLAESLNNLAVLCQQRGELKRARALYEEAETLAIEIGDRVMVSIALNNRGEVLVELGEFDEAHEVLAQAEALTNAIGERRIRFDVFRNLARIKQHRGELDKALDLIAQAQNLARQMDAPLLRGMALLTEGELHTAAIDSPLDLPTPVDHMVHAEDCFRESIKLLQDIGDESELGRCLSAYGHFLIKQGLTIQGRKRLEMAKSIFARLNMRRVLEQTERAMDDLS